MGVQCSKNTHNAILTYGQGCVICAKFNRILCLDGVIAYVAPSIINGGVLVLLFQFSRFIILSWRNMYERPMRTSLDFIKAAGLTSTYLQVISLISYRSVHYLDSEGQRWIEGRGKEEKAGDEGRRNVLIVDK